MLSTDDNDDSTHVHHAIVAIVILLASIVLNVLLSCTLEWARRTELVRKARHVADYLNAIRKSATIVNYPPLFMPFSEAMHLQSSPAVSNSHLREKLNEGIIDVGSHKFFRANCESKSGSCWKLFPSGQCVMVIW
jgi:hypothetical protein